MGTHCCSAHYVAVPPSPCCCRPPCPPVLSTRCAVMDAVRPQTWSAALSPPTVRSPSKCALRTVTTSSVPPWSHTSQSNVVHHGTALQDVVLRMTGTAAETCLFVLQLRPTVQSAQRSVQTTVPMIAVRMHLFAGRKCKLKEKLMQKI